MTTEHSEHLLLNVVPVSFSQDTFWVGTTPYKDDDGYQSLRELHWRTHAFRFNSHTGLIENTPVVEGAEPLGEASQVSTQERLLLTARAVQHATLVWIAGRLPIQRSGKQLTFWGQAERAKLLSQVLDRLRLQHIDGLEVTLRYTLDCRIFNDGSGGRFLGLTIGVGTSNQIEIPVSELLERGISLVGREVCRRRQFEHDYLRPNLETVGRVIALEGQRVRLADALDVEVVDADTVMLQPTLWNLNDVVTLYFGQKAPVIIRELEAQRQRIGSSAGKLQEIKTTLAGLKTRRLFIGKDAEIQLGDCLDSADPRFPRPISTPQPTLLFGPQGRNTELYADFGIKRHGPYRYSYHTRNFPTIGVVCEQRYEGRVDAFVKLLRDGFPDELCAGAQNPFVGGLVRKYQLLDARIVIETCANDSASSYRAAARRLLQRNQHQPLDLALVQVREEHKQRFGDDSPYYVTKAVFMGAGVPTQSVRAEVIEQTGISAAYILNNLALAC
jgi:hypothetical protein